MFWSVGHFNWLFTIWLMTIKSSCWSVVRNLAGISLRLFHFSFEQVSDLPAVFVRDYWDYFAFEQEPQSEDFQAYKGQPQAGSQRCHQSKGDLIVTAEIRNMEQTDMFAKAGMGLPSTGIPQGCKIHFFQPFIADNTETVLFSVRGDYLFFTLSRSRFFLNFSWQGYRMYIKWAIQWSLFFTDGA